MKTNILNRADAHYIRELLNGFIEELSLTFLERRGRQASHRVSILEELEDVISIITQREKDLLTSVHLALELLDENDKLTQKMSNCKKKLLNFQDKIMHLSKDVEALQDNLRSSEERYENLNKTLADTEEMMLINSAELNRLNRERVKEASLKGSNEEIDYIKKTFKSQVDELEKKRWDLEREKSSISQKLLTFQKDLNESNDKNFKITLKLEKVQEHNKDLQRQLDHANAQIEKIEKEYQVLNSQFYRAKIQCEKLEEDLSLRFMKETDSPPKLGDLCHTSSQIEMPSLEDELEGIFDYDSENLALDDSDSSQLGNSSTRLAKVQRASSYSYLKLLTTDRPTSIQISPEKVQRKSPPEEYFALSVQAVKMNSPHMDNIINASASQLYQKAIKMGIPFHKWHVWIESQLNSIYVQTIYKKNTKGTWRRYTQKMCLSSC